MPRVRVGGGLAREDRAGGEGENLDVVECTRSRIHVERDHHLVGIPADLGVVGLEATFADVEVVSGRSRRTGCCPWRRRAGDRREGSGGDDEPTGDVVVGDDRIERRLAGLAEEHVQGRVRQQRRPGRLVVELDLRIDGLDDELRTDGDVGVGRHVAVDRIQEVHPVEAVDNRRVQRRLGDARAVRM